MTDQDRQIKKKQVQTIEQEALAALRAHRQQSGYIPWNHYDNERLKTLDKKQRQQELECQAQREGEEIYLRHKNQASTIRFSTVADALSQMALVPRPLNTQPEPLLTLVSQISPEAEEFPPLTIRIDPELARVAVGLDKASEFYVWALARHYFGVPGKTTRNALFEVVSATSAIKSRRHLNRILKQGRGVFWRLDKYGNVYLIGYVKLAIHLTRSARKNCPQLVETNIPGTGDIYIKVGESVGEFKAYIYLGWLTYRQAPTISREVLTSLFNCTKITLRNWEQILGSQLEIVTNYAQTALDPKIHDEIIDYLPGHHYCYVTRRGQIRLRWRLSNTYRTSGVQEHAHKGQSRKARTVAAYTAWCRPVESDTHLPDFQLFMEKVAFDRSHRVPKRYFETQEQLERFLKRMAQKGMPGVTPKTPRYIYLGENCNKHGIFELSLDGYANTKAGERLRPRAEYAWWKGWQAKWDLVRSSVAG